MNDEVAAQVEPDAYIIPAPILQNLVRYLGSRPYGEVHEGVAALMALQPYKSQEPQEDPISQELIGT